MDRTIDLGLYLGMLLTTFWVSLLFLEFTGVAKKIYNTFFKFELEERVEKYKFDYQSYRYWQYMARRSFWESLDGHQFELVVANLYMLSGFEATVSKQGGDKGVDIVLVKGSERFAVQCKAHKRAVSPAVARDLYGTMGHFGYKKGILVSLNGFTQGVYDFIVGKNIELVTVDDLILMNENIRKR